jgi:aspartate oxidase
MGISKIMKNYCGEVKHDELLKIGLKQLKDYESSIASETYAYNPHELIRLLEVFDILTVSEIIINSCLRRKSSSKPLCFVKFNSSEISDAQMLITIRQTGSKIVTRELNTDFFGDLNENYEKHNKKYINEKNRNGR